MKKEIFWDLTPLYASFTDEALQTDKEKLEQLYTSLLEKAIALNSATDPVTACHNYLATYNEASVLSNKLYNFGALSYSVDTANSQAMNLVETVESFFPKLTLAEAHFKMWLKDFPDFENLLTSQLLSEFRFYLTSMKKEATHALSTAEEELFSLMQNTGSNAWSKLQDQTVAGLTGNFRGEDLVLSALRAKAYDKDQATRREAYEVELASYPKMDTVSAACLNAIKGEAITNANKRGYASVLDMTLENSRMDKETLTAMITAMEESLPAFRRYFRKKAELLGHKNGLPFYDLFAPVGEVAMEYSYEEAKQYVIDNFSQFSPELGNFAANAFAHNWIDVYPRKGKISGAFCSGIKFLEESRIMTNFDGSLSDVYTLAHELGHGFHDYCMKGLAMINSDYPMPLAETASIFCETIVTNASLKTATDQEKTVILETDIMSTAQVIVDILSRYYFESELIDKRKNGSLSVEELKSAMLNAQKRAYGNGLDEDYLHPYMWMCKPHYYSAGSNFYNFPYAFGELFAKGLYALYEKESAPFVEKYKALLRATGNHNIHDVLAIVGMDSHSPDFFRNSLALTVKRIEEWVTLVS
ncbi:M3 family oligoendopeptidase [Clostridiales bacterium COT073_COT-073]|nr:M3 family oligoendopeptidase [Clostridiales bacterium COT073_COT-073]